MEHNNSVTISPAKVLLFGIKHSGKTSLGKMLSKAFGWPFSDLDDCIEMRTQEEAGVSIRDFFRAEERDRFFTIERSCLGTFLENRPAPWILATGGGIIDNTTALALVPEGTVKVFLHNAPAILYERIIRKGLPPFMSADDPYGSFLSIYNSRTSRYRALADIIVDRTDETKEESIQTLITLLKGYIDGGK
jgi:shikimate kinase